MNTPRVNIADHDRIATSVIIGATVRNGLTYKDIEKVMCVSHPTYLSKIKNPGTMTLDQFRAVAAKLRLSDSEIIDVLK